MRGTAEEQSSFTAIDVLCEELLDEKGFLVTLRAARGAVIRHEDFNVPYPSGRGRPSHPPSLLAAQLLAQLFYGTGSPIAKPSGGRGSTCPGRSRSVCRLSTAVSRTSASSAHDRVTGPIVLAEFQRAILDHGTPWSTLTDNRMVYTARFAGGRGGRNGFEFELRRLGVRQKNSRPNRPTTCGEVERFQQTLKKWLRAQPQPASVPELQALCDRLVAGYNDRRPHRSLSHHATPASSYRARPKATPGDRDRDTHARVRRDRVDNAGAVTLRMNGRLHHIGIGRSLAGTRSCF